MREYKTSDVYQVFCNQFQNAELSAALQAELVRAKQVNQNSTLFRELAGRPKGSGAWFSWASAEPLEVSLLREMAEEERLAMVFALADVPIVGLPPERIHREAEERCVLFLREGMAAAAPDPLIRKLEPKDLPLLDGLFDHPDITQAQRAVYRGAYEVIISAEDAPDFAGAVYGLLEEGQLLAAIQITTQSYASLHFRQNAMINPFTRPDQRRRGHGAALMNHVLGLFPGEQVKYEYDGENESAQKLALARLCVGSFGLYLLDEPSSALDPLAEHELLNAMLEQTRGKTMIMVAHRLSTVRHMDRIYVFSGGRVAEQGSHDQLME